MPFVAPPGLGRRQAEYPGATPLESRQMPEDFSNCAGFEDRGYDLVLPAAGAFEHVNLEHPRQQLGPGYAL